MPKRSSPFDANVSCHQLKTHISSRHFTSNSGSAMHTVYEKTLRLLAEGSKHSSISNADAVVISTVDSPYVPPADQLRMNSAGQLLHKESSACGGIESSTFAENNNVPISRYSHLKDSKSNEQSNGRLSCDPSADSLKSKCHSCGQNMQCFNVTLPCSWCDRKLCCSCQLACLTCSGTFCHLCTTVNYDEHFERTFCLQCSLVS